MTEILLAAVFFLLGIASHREYLRRQPPPRLKRPAQVGATRFGAGVAESLVIERAQREFAYQATPEKEAARIVRGGARIRRFLGLCEACDTPDSCDAIRGCRLGKRASP